MISGHLVLRRTAHSFIRHLFSNCSCCVSDSECIGIVAGRGLCVIPSHFDRALPWRLCSHRNPIYRRNIELGLSTFCAMFESFASAISPNPVVFKSLFSVIIFTAFQAILWKPCSHCSTSNHCNSYNRCRVFKGCRRYRRRRWARAYRICWTSDGFRWVENLRLFVVLRNGFPFFW